jgi:hypothetical protein
MLSADKIFVAGYFKKYCKIEFGLGSFEGVMHK